MVGAPFREMDDEHEPEVRRSPVVFLSLAAGMRIVRLVTAPTPPSVSAATSPVARRWLALSGSAEAMPRFGHANHYPAHSHLLRGRGAGVSLDALNSGWACLSRTLADGRRQIQHVFVPGDLLIAGGAATAGSHLVALTPVAVAQGQMAEADWASAPIRRSVEAFHQQLLHQIVRLGRQHAAERIAHLFLELRDRLLTVGIGEARRFEMPLTQELLADVLGLTSVHVNRTLQAMRREGLVAVGGRVVELPDPAGLARLADYRSVPSA